MRKNRVSPLNAFSLIELITVMAVIAIGTSLTVPAFKNLATSNQLVNGANLVTGLLNQARVVAVSQNTQTAVYFCQSSNTTSEKPMRSASVWSWNPDSATWIQVTKWETLPEGIVFQPSTPTATASYDAFDTATLKNSLPTTIDGNASTVAEVRFNSLGVVFANATSIAAATPIREMNVRLTSGFVQQGSVHSTSPDNWIDVRTDGLTGRVGFVQN